MAIQKEALPKVSIIIPVYNVEPYISACLQSVMAQTYTGELECIIVDDRGKDNSMAVAEREVNAYNGKVDFKIIHREQNGGLSAARNTGIRHATGDYLYFLDSDDEITPDCIALLAEKAASLQPDFVIGGYRVTGTDKKMPSLHLPDGAFLKGEEIIKTYSHGKWYMMAWGKLVNRKFLVDHSLYFKEGLLHEDELWSFQLACLARSMAVVNRQTYVYKVREGSIMVNANMELNRIKAFKTIIGEMVDFVKSREIGSKQVACVVLQKASEMGIFLCKLESPLPLESNDIANKVREKISEIPFSKRLLVSMSGAKNFVRFCFSILPIACWMPLNKLRLGLARIVLRKKI